MSDMLTEVRLLNIPLERDYKHTYYFPDKTTQTNFFSNGFNAMPIVYDCSFLRKDGIIRYPAHIDSLEKANYVMYKNASHSTRWYYAFIIGKEYKNDNMTELRVETDVMQTYLTEYTVRPSFVEREHTIDDVLGRNTVPEGLELGEYICNHVDSDTKTGQYSYLIQVTEWTDGTKPVMTNYGGVWVAGGAYICKTPNELAQIVNLYNTSEEGNADAIQAVYIVPDELVETYLNENTIQYRGADLPHTYEKIVSKQHDLDGYTPRNDKLLSYPYQYLLVSNNSGNSNIYQYEHFDDTVCRFQVSGVPTVGCSIKCDPMKYKGADVNYQEGLMLGKFPTCSWSKDIYTNWLTQNAVNIGVGIASAGAQVLLGGAMTAFGGAVGAIGGAGTMASGITGIASTIGQVYQMSFTPNSAEGNINGGDVNASARLNRFMFYHMSIKAEYARIIDDYFSMFGYKTCRVKVPNTDHREKWWYTKTVDANIDGAFSTEHLEKIKECYNKGITFWRSSVGIGQYQSSDGTWRSNAITKI